MACCISPNRSEGSSDSSLDHYKHGYYFFIGINLFTATSHQLFAICCGIFLNLTSSKQAEAIGVYSPTLPPIQPTYLKKICAGLFFDLKELLPDNVALIQRLNETEMLSSFSPPLSSTWTTEINNPDVLLGDWLWGHSRSSGLCSNNFSATGPKTRWLGLAHIQSALSAADGW